MKFTGSHWFAGTATEPGVRRPSTSIGCSADAAMKLTGFRGISQDPGVATVCYKELRATTKDSQSFYKTCQSVLPTQHDAPEREPEPFHLRLDRCSEILSSSPCLDPMESLWENHHDDLHASPAY